MNKHPMKRYLQRGFTLIEILIVVVILGSLAAVVISQFGNAKRDAERTTFLFNGKTFFESARRFHLKTGFYLEDAASGVLPVGFEQFVQAEKWVGGTPIGGVWDTELNSFGIVSALGVHFDGTGATQDAAYMQQIDTMIDDGDLATGGFQQIANDRYYFVMVN